MLRRHAYRGRAGAAAVAAVRPYHPQHRTPILPQAAVGSEAGASHPVYVSYLLHRAPVVKPTPHPLETEFSFLLEREHQRYSRHEANDSATQFMAQRGQAIDILNRTEPAQIKGNFYGLELYQDAMKIVLKRYAPEKRVTEHDRWSPESLQGEQPPPRHSIHRSLEDYLYLIIRGSQTGQWTLPRTELRGSETLRMAAERGVAEHSSESLDVYFWSNAPQAAIDHPTSGGPSNAKLFIFSATYLSGRPRFDQLQPTCDDHAWVTRSELSQYMGTFDSDALLPAMLDITADSAFES